MADKDHLKLLASGAEDWNAWRDENPSLRPDLSVADLTAKKFSGFNLKQADLAWGDLREARCECTDLSGADLADANLRKGTFRASHFNACKMKKAYMAESDFFAQTLPFTIEDQLEDLRPLFQGYLSAGPEQE